MVGQIYPTELQLNKLKSFDTEPPFWTWTWLLEPEFNDDLVYKLKKIVGSDDFSAQFIKIISHYKEIGYNSNVLQQTVCLVVNPITIGNFAFLFNCTPAGRTSDSMTVPT